MFQNHYLLHCLLYFLPIFYQNLNAEVPPHVCDPLVNTRHGQVQGFCTRVGERMVRTFLGIPYAAPPVGPLRFQHPKPLKVTWNNTYHSVRLGPTCPEPLLGNDASRCDRPVTRNEDCLYLNIWSPASTDVAKGGKRKPVIVWIHGGGLIMLSGNDCKINGGKIAAAIGDFVVVSVNFRQGILGFSYSGTHHFPGNQGLMDIVMAVDWVYDNIQAFGGDQRRIALAGLSSGGFAAGWVWLSGLTGNKTQGLMLHSGGPGDPLCETTSQSMERFAIVAKNVGCINSKNPNADPFSPEILKCVREAPMPMLLMAQTLPNNRVPANRPEVVLPTLVEPVLASSLKEVWKRERWPKNKWIYVSTVTDEGHIMRPHMGGATFLKHSDMIDTIKAVGPKMFRPNQVESGTQDLIKTYAIGYENATATEMEVGFRDLIGDWYIRCPLIYFSKRMAETNKVYASKFTYTKKIGPIAETYGSRHGVDVYFFFGGPFRDAIGFTDLDRQTSAFMINVWSDFLNYGKSIWPPYQRTSNGRVIFLQREIDFRKEIRKTVHDADACRCEMWYKYYDI
ncbi:cholinesterase-like [Brevipalpus obovatus]|uniref:cholinesterase-like n=1 Tax=Brevipalpus obovatus TaxID=246614 RepID=UPI003D9F1295